MTVTPCRLSVVVASNNARASIAECLSILAPRGDGRDVELVVVDNSTDGTDGILRRDFPTVRVIAAPPQALIPELWTIGIRQTRGELVAITTAHCVPHKDWVPRILEALRGDEAAVGGAIENDPSAGLVEWAIYFCRYSSFMLPLPRAIVPEIAGDNACYRRAPLDACRDAWSDGFFEPAVHARLRSAGLRLLFEPGIVVVHKKSFGVVSFVTQRFLHGMEFGRDRVARCSAVRRLIYIGLAPAIPAVLLARIARRVLGKRRHRAALLRCAPLLLLFLLAWSSGESIGYLRGRRGEAPR